MQRLKRRLKAECSTTIFRLTTMKESADSLSFPRAHLFCSLIAAPSRSLSLYIRLVLSNQAGDSPDAPPDGLLHRTTWRGTARNC